MTCSVSFCLYRLRVVIVVALSAGSFIITAASVGDWMSFLGIICASVSSGLGEVTFLSYSSVFHRSVVSGWSSGTGAAGLVGAGAYAVATLVLDARSTLLVMLIVPIMLALTFWFLIVHPKRDYLEAVATRPLIVNRDSPTAQFDIDAHGSRDSTTLVSRELSFHEKLRLVRELLWRFMAPLGLVYFFEYFINQGFFELLYFTNTSIVHKQQYR